MKAALGLLVLFAASCSSSAGGPEYASLALQATDMTGRKTDRTCIGMPVMPGGRVEREVRMGGAFVVHVAGTRDGVDVTFSGVNDADDARQSYTHGELVDGISETIAVEATDGDVYELALSSPCPAES